ncbi:MAG TPA: tyrosine-type recombinase/integrase [Vicinamibacterales bacterium]|jgi:integrase
MLTLYRRHYPPCRHTSRRFRKCQCPIWVQGTLRGEVIKKSLDLRSWEAASDLVRGWEASGEIGIVKPEIPSVSEAVERFVAYQCSRHLAPETIRKYGLLLEKRLVSWCTKTGRTQLRQLTVDALRQFQQTWEDGALYAIKNLERLCAFFEFCLDAQWIERNPTKALRRPKAKHAPTLPFSQEEMKRILDACDRYPGNQGRLKAFVLVMRHSGLRISDATALSKDRLDGNKLFLYTAKTGTPVYVPLPPTVIQALGKLDTNGSGRFFTTGNAKPVTAHSNWSRYLDKLFELAKVENGHSHRFRDTFAVELLLAGVPLETVSILLGHSSIKVTEKHYKPWVKTLQSKLEQEVMRAWA